MLFTDFETLNQYINDNVKDRRPVKIKAAEIRNVLLGITQLIAELGSGLPELADNQGKMLITDGTTLKWVAAVLKLSSHHFQPDGKTYINTDLTGMDLAIFWNNINRFLIGETEAGPDEEAEYTIRPDGGFEILLNGFDAVANKYRLFVIPTAAAGDASGKLNQTISFPQPAVMYNGDGIAPVTVSASSGLPVSLSSSNTDVIAVSGSNVLYITGTGTTLITATQTGNTVYNAAASVSRTVEVLSEDEEIQFIPATPRVYAPEIATIYASPAGGGLEPYKDRIDNLIQRLKINNLWDAIQVLYIHVGWNKRLNIKDPYDEAASYALDMPEGVYATDSALQFNTGQYGNTRYSMGANLNSDSFGIFCYNTYTANDATGVVLGAKDEENAQLKISYGPRQFNAWIGSNKISLFDPPRSRSIYTAGLYALNYTGGVASFYAGGAFQRLNMLNAFSLPVADIYLGAVNNAGTLDEEEGTSNTCVSGITSGIPTSKTNALAGILNKYVGEINEMQNDRTIITYGDSITIGYYADPMNENKWIQLVANATGLDIAFTQAEAGMTLMDVNTPSTNSLYYRIFDDNYHMNGSRVYNSYFKYLFIALGINDALNISNAEGSLALFNTQYRAIIDRLIELKWPLSKMKLITPYLTHTSLGITTTQYTRWNNVVTMIKQIGADYGLQVLDITTAMSTNGGTTLVVDDRHPSTEGHAVIADYIIEALGIL